NLWGYTVTGTDALAQTASLIGIYGLTFLSLLIFASPAAFGGLTARTGARNWVLPSLCLALLAAGWGWGSWRLANAAVAFHPGIKLRIVQPNIPQAEKWRPESRRWILDRLMKLSREGPNGNSSSAKLTHLIWPETSVPFLFMLNGKITSAEAQRIFASLVPSDGVMILGAERVDGQLLSNGRINPDAVYNSLFVLGKNAHVMTVYDKEHLVPFGEYVPFEKTLASIGIKKFTQGTTGSNPAPHGLSSQRAVRRLFLR
ncbi:MAG: apolipoprotein N-acyltransferase, partial [Alphaproteobacteria bacterium]